jgi:methylenetetrahydrofolate dehydrogenase (NADP+)/methenyltetrahydrofolate cyclohydrolase
MEPLRHAEVEPEGLDAVIVGRSILVGRPLASLLLNADATVTVCHSRPGICPACRRADISPCRRLCRVW